LGESVGKRRPSKNPRLKEQKKNWGKKGSLITEAGLRKMRGKMPNRDQISQHNNYLKRESKDG